MAMVQYTRSRSGHWVGAKETIPTLPPAIYKVYDEGEGVEFRPAEIITDDLIDIPDGVGADVYADMLNFFKTSETWRKFRLSHKRGYLLYGPPGTGKTSVSIQMARRLVNDGGIAVIIESLGDLYQTVETLGEIEPDRQKMFIIEEAEELVRHRIALSVLDGALSISNSIFVATTNHIEQLPGRIVNRPGRFAQVRLIDRPDVKVQRLYLFNIISRVQDADREAALLSADRVLAGLCDLPGLTLDHLREAFACHHIMGDDIAVVVKRVRDMVPPIKELSLDLSEDDFTDRDSDEPID